MVNKIEYRVGNYVIYNEKIIVITEEILIQILRNEIEASPLKLESRILFNFGFTASCITCLQLEQINIVQTVTGFEIFLGDPKTFIRILHNCHELQNLFFDIYGRMLILPREFIVVSRVK